MPNAAESAASRVFWREQPDAFAAADPLGGFYAARAALAADLMADLITTCGACGTALDVGCGSGRLTALLARQGRCVTALDLSLSQLARTARRCAGQAVDLRSGGLEMLRDGERFAAVFALGVLPYIDDQPAYLAALARRVAPGGGLVVSITRSASLFTLVALARHARQFRASAAWWRVAANLARTGIWSGGFATPEARISIAQRGRLDRAMRALGFVPEKSVILHNVGTLDRAPAHRGLLARQFASWAGWCVVAAYRRCS